MVIIIALYELSTANEISAKAAEMLNKIGLNIPQIGSNIYSYFLTIRDDKGSDLSMDALIQVKVDKISVLKIWEMEFDSKKATYSARNVDGEYGAYAKELAIKYMMAFLLVLESVNINSLIPA